MANKLKTRWALRTYDVWGNSRDGYDVNDSFARGEFEIMADVRTYNVGTPQEFQSATVSDKAIR
jgi:hypothetical protein